MRRLAEILADAGMDVDVICLRAADQATIEVNGRITAHRLALLRPRQNILQYLRSSIPFMLAASVKLKALLRLHRYAWVQVHNMPDFLVFAALPARKRGIPVVMDIQDVSVELYASKWGASRSRRLMLGVVKAVEALACSKADHILTASQGFRERLTERGVPGRKLTVLLNAPDPKWFRFAEGRQFQPIVKGARLLYYGTVAKRFGVLVAIRALAELQKRVPQSSLTIYGRYDPDYQEAIKDEIERLGLLETVTLNEFLAHEKIFHVVRGCDFGVVPYLSDDFMGLAMSTKALEFATMGLPFVGSNLAPMRSVFGLNGVPLSEPGDPTTLANALYMLCRDPLRRRAYVQTARSCVSAVDFDVMKRRYVDAMRPFRESQ